MDDQRDRHGGHASAEVIVREFRQVLLYPLQLVPVAGRAQTAANWERLLALDTAWHDAEDYLAEARGPHAERHYAEFVTFMPDVQHFLYGGGRSASATSGYGDSPIRVFQRTDVAQAEVTLRRGDQPIVFDVARVELYFFYDIDLALLAVELVGRDITLAQAQDMLFRFGRAYPSSWRSHWSAPRRCAIF